MMRKALSNTLQLPKLVKADLEKFGNMFTKEKQLIKGDTQVAYSHRGMNVACTQLSGREGQQDPVHQESSEFRPGHRLQMHAPKTHAGPKNGSL